MPVMVEQPSASNRDVEADDSDQDAEPTMTAPPALRPDAGASIGHAGGQADSPDAADADEADRGTPQP